MHGDSPADGKRLEALLPELEEHWRRNGAPIADALQPGIPPQESQPLAATIGVRLPTEALIWYAWHNGTHADDRQPGLRACIGSVYDIFSLQQALAATEEMRESAALSAAGPNMQTAEYYWDPFWLSIGRAVNGMEIALDCAVEDGDAAPVRAVDWEFDDFRDVAAPSLTDVVALWVDLLRRGAWRYDPEAGRWRTDNRRLEPNIRMHRLA